MKCKLLLTIITFSITINCFSQLKLPEVGTTSTKAVSDLANGITNELWFTSKNNDGTITYQKYFKVTPVGIKHALTEFENLKKAYQPNTCKDESIYSSLALNEDKEIDYELLSITIKSESSEIYKICGIQNDVVRGISLKSLNSDSVNYLFLMLFTNKK
jgi:hypothetical protein